ncbi:transcriptional regulator [Amycolatopsis antarctica]|uniref:Transcriptional regulator n=1 Tax=Amycolatopsis antarctica TaxID=1854586 RepID=A0A263D152_9PSEU|nr:helix-turn-helix transcriptional regulator [Amycolatopsis antarctica]OZM71367.1 transcriptional regulator [Amycolatopsis antarctica]
MVRNDPAAARWLVGVELRHYRNRAHKTAKAAAEVIGSNHSKIIHMETGRYGQKPGEVTDLLGFYGAPDSELARVAALAEYEDGPPWWEPWNKVVSDSFATFIGLEGMAERVLTYEPLLMSALFQTESYAMAVTGVSHRVPLDQQDLVVELRMERQRRLREVEPLKVHAVIEESVLRRIAGDERVMRGQLEHLLELAELPSITWQILPTRHGIRATTFGKFDLLGLPSGREIVYVESLYGADYVHEKTEVRGYTLLLDSVRGEVLDEDESVALVKQVITETR